MQVDNGHFQANLGHMRPFWWKILGVCPILMYEIDFDVQEESKYTITNNGEKISEGGYPGKNKSEMAQFSPLLATF